MDCERLARLNRFAALRACPEIGWRLLTWEGEAPAEPDRLVDFSLSRFARRLTLPISGHARNESDIQVVADKMRDGLDSPSRDTQLVSHSERPESRSTSAVPHQYSASHSAWTFTSVHSTDLEVRRTRCAHGARIPRTKTLTRLGLGPLRFYRSDHNIPLPLVAET